MTGEQNAPFVDFLVVARRRRWSLIMPIVLGIGAGVALVELLPREYVSSATLAVTSPSVSGDLARATPQDPSERIRAITHQLLSHEVVERVAREEGLVGDRSVDDVVADIRARTSISLPEQTLASTTRFEPDTFVVSFSGPTPELARRVTDRLAQVFIATHSHTRETRAEGTSSFLAGQLRQAEERLKAAEARLQQVKDTYQGRLPEQALSNLQIVGSLRQQAEANAAAMRSDRDRLVVIDQQLQAMQQDAEVAAASEAEQKTTELTATLERQLAEAKMVYTERHPETQRLQAELATAKAAADQARASSDPRRQSTIRLDPAYRQLMAERESVRLRIADAQAADARVRQELAQYQARVDSTPLVEQQLVSLTREYELEKAQYQRLAERHQAALIAEDLERRGAGEQFTVLYPAYLPSMPATPNVPLVLAFSLLSGIVLGVGLAMMREFFDRAVYDARTLQHEFDHAVLAEIPHVQRSMF